MQGLEHGNFSPQYLGRMMQASLRANALSGSAAASTNNGAAANARATALQMVEMTANDSSCTEQFSRRLSRRLRF